MDRSKVGNLFEEPLVVVNIGLDRFAEELTQQGIKVSHVEWTPPAGGNPKLADLLSKLGT